MQSNCAQGTQYSFDATQHVFVVVQGTAASAYMQFSYQLVDRMDIVEISIIYSVSVFTFVLLIGLIMVLTARYCIQQVIKQNQDYWKKMAVEMSSIVKSAQRIKETAPSPMPTPSHSHAPSFHTPPPPPFYEQSRQHNQIHPGGGSYGGDPYGPPRDDYYSRPPPPPRSGLNNYY
jgi:hypothetical protein